MSRGRTMLQRSGPPLVRWANRLDGTASPMAARGEPPAPHPGRHEFKYLIRDDRSEAIAASLQPYLDLDKYSESRSHDSYTVRSIYYDSPAFTCYHEKANGEKNRRKYRLRSYNGAGTSTFLECKQRWGGTYTKRKERLTEDDVIALRERRGLDATIASPAGVLGQLLLGMDRWNYEPTSLVVYDREAYVSPGQQDTARVTFDRNLRARLFPELDEIHSETDLVPLLYGWTILEVKFNDIVPRFLRRLVTAHGLQRQACSKYGVSIASLLDENPTRKEGWNHVYVR